MCFQAAAARSRRKRRFGFGISTPEQSHRMAAIADGAIVDSAIVKLMAQYSSEAPAHVGEFVRRMKQAL